MLIHITIFADLLHIWCTVVTTCVLVSFATFPEMAYFSLLPSLLASVGVILALWRQSFTSEMTCMYHEYAMPGGCFSQRKSLRGLIGAN